MREHKLLKAVLGKEKEREGMEFSFSSKKANLNLRQGGLKDLGIKAINWLLSELKHL